MTLPPFGEMPSVGRVRPNAGNSGVDTDLNSPEAFSVALRAKNPGEFEPVHRAALAILADPKMLDQTLRQPLHIGSIDLAKPPEWTAWQTIFRLKALRLSMREGGAGNSSLLTAKSQLNAVGMKDVAAVSLDLQILKVQKSNAPFKDEIIAALRAEREIVQAQPFLRKGTYDCAAYDLRDARSNSKLIPQAFIDAFAKNTSEFILEKGATTVDRSRNVILAKEASLRGIIQMMADALDSKDLRIVASAHYLIARQYALLALPLMDICWTPAVGQAQYLEMRNAHYAECEAVLAQAAKKFPDASDQVGITDAKKALRNAPGVTSIN